MSKQQETPPKKASLRIVLPNGEIVEHLVAEKETQIGSGTLNDIVIADPEVSANHAILAFHNDDYFIMHEPGASSILVNGTEIAKPKKLASGDIIKIGNSEITFLSKLGAAALESRLANVTGFVPSSALDELRKAQKGKKKEPAGLAEAGEKEKKEKKEKVDERVKAARVRAWGGIIATVLSVVLTVTISLVVTRMGSNQPAAVGSGGGGKEAKKVSAPADFRAISGGKFEASGAAAVPDAHGILFVDDSKPDHVFYMPVSELGVQDGPIKPIPLGVSVLNPEGITQYGNQYVIIGALATQESNDAGGIATFTFDPVTQTVSNAVALSGMRKFLFDNVPVLRPWADKSSLEGGLNVEAIAFDPNPRNPRLLLGLRGPLLNGLALVIPIRLRDRQAPIKIENLVIDETNAIQLTLDGQAIRDMKYDTYLRSFLIISGAPETEEKTTFTLWEWNGDANQGQESARPKMQTPLDKKMKPEGITSLQIGNQEFIFIVGDASAYTKIDYLP